MFRSFVYLNDDKMYAYKSILDRQPNTTPKSYSKTQKTTGKIIPNLVSAELSAERTESGEISTSIIYHYNQFEEALNQVEGESFFNFTLYDHEYDIKTLPTTSIIKVQGFLEIPDDFDIFQMVTQYKPFIEQYSGIPSEKEFEVKEILKMVNSDVPIMMEYDDVLIAAKLTSKHLLEDYTELENYQELPITLLCKVEGLIDKDEVAIYNPLKDFIKMNRTMRRMSNLESNEQLQPIYVEGPVLKVEVIAIYK